MIFVLCACSTRISQVGMKSSFQYEVGILCKMFKSSKLLLSLHISRDSFHTLRHWQELIQCN